MFASLVRRTRSPALGCLILSTTLSAQTGLTTPKEALGFTIGDDYMLATYSQLTDWWKKLDAESDRLQLVSIGKTAEGRDQWMAIVTAPQNAARLDRYREIARRLAKAEGLTDEEARALAKEGKAVVWIDGGLHATEVLGAHQLMEHVWQMASRDDEETQRILRDVIQLVVHANPDGMELVSSWYMRNSDPTKRSTGQLPRLYQKYVGHDNNRDFYLNAMPESENMSRVMYREWYPQVMYNHHQSGPVGTVLFVPPFRDPHNHYLDPLLVNGISLVGAAMHTRFAAEGKPGATMREGASYQTWWNGGLRTAAYFHNIIGILTETIGSPTPMEIPFVPERQLATGILPFPIPPQRWHFRQSVDYSITANRAILDLASRYRETLLWNIYLMGKNSIRRGSEDTWTNTPKEIEAVRRAATVERDARQVASPGSVAGSGQLAGGAVVDRKLYTEHLRNPADREPRAYIIPADQADFPTATKFVNALLKSGVDVHRATAPFAVGGKEYPAGSWIVKSAQAFRPHVLDMFEPQDYPNDLAYPGGPPRAPYDNSGYTLAFQMAVGFDRILDGFDGPFERVTELAVKPAVAPMPKGRSYLISRRVNDGFLAVNRLLAERQTVQVLTQSLTDGGRTWPAGTWYVPATAQATTILRTLNSENGLPVFATNTTPPALAGLRPVRLGLWDQYGGSMPSGWIRWLFERFEFPHEVVYAPRLDQGGLRRQFDVLVFVGGAIPSVAGQSAGAGGGGGRAARLPVPEEIPAEYHDRLGRVTVEKTVPELKAFLEAGGTIITIGGAANLARHLGLPVGDHLAEREPSGTVRPLPQEKFYIPASLLEVAVDNSGPVGWGMEETAIVMFDENPVFRLPADAAKRGVRPIAWYASASPLRSGWAWGQTYLENGVAAVEAKVGSGTLYLFGPEITFRAQPHGTFKFLFNGIANAGL